MKVGGAFKIGNGESFGDWAMDDLIFCDELEGGETQGGTNVEERIMVHLHGTNE